MGTTSEKLQKILTTKESIKSAIISKGVSITDSDTFASYADKILEIQSIITSSKINTIEEIKNNWKYKLISSASSPSYNSTAEAAKDFDDSTWDTISIPHDWSIYNEFNSSSAAGYEGGYLDGGDSWYRRRLDLTNSTKQIYIYFDGVYKDCDIYVNGTKVGDNKWYNPFYFDITSELNFDGNDVLAVFIRNRQPSSRWYSGSGIIRNVYLVTGQKSALGIDNIKITSENLEEELYNGLVNTKIETDIINSTDSEINVSIKYTISFKGEEINSLTTPSKLIVGTNKIVNTIQIPNPVLWDEYKGNLYEAKIEMTYGSDIIYSSKTKYGYRYFKFDSEKGFFLNGKSLKMRGVCLHHDLGCIGAEINSSAIERQIRIMKDMGCNAIRITHNPASPEMLNICAREGIMVIEEAFDVWERLKKQYDFCKDFNNYAESSIKYMVKRGVNNPAIIMWSIGNEIGGATVSTATKLVNWVKEIDTTRAVTMGMNDVTTEEFRNIMDVLDVVGGNYKNSNAYNYLRSLKPGVKLYSSETTSAFSSRGVYARDNDNNQCSSFDDDRAGWGEYASTALKDNMNTAYVGGMFVWTGFDYIGEPTPFNAYPSRSSYFGIVDLAGFPKDIYYMYQSRWTDKPMIHILPHWTHQSGNIKVWLYSNCYKVELFLNGTSLGSKLQTNIGSKYEFEYSVPYSEGTLVANGYDSKNNLIAQDVVYTSYAPSKIKLISDKSMVNINSDDLIFIECDILDRNGNICPTANNEITFTCTGGTVVGTDNGDATDVSHSLRSNIRKAFNGKALCVVRPDRTSSKVTVTATSTDLTRATLDINQGKLTSLSTIKSEFIDATNPPIPDGTTIEVTNIVLSKNNLNLGVDDSITLNYTLVPNNTTQTGVTFTANPSGIVSISGNTITGVSNGTCTVTATSSEKPSVSATCEVTVTAAAVKITNIELDNNTLSIDNGSNKTLTATITPPDATNKILTWSANNENVILTPSGNCCLVTGKAVGESIITVSANDGSGKSATCTVTINLVNVPVEGVSLDKTEASVKVGKSVNLTATITPENATNPAVTWTKDNDNITLTPNSNIVTVMGVTKGTSVVTATTSDGSYTAECRITINEGIEGYTALRENYTATGVVFKDDTTYDIDSQTFFADITIDKSVDVQNILSLSSDIVPWGNNKISHIHLFNQNSTNSVEADFLTIGSREKVDIPSIDNRIKIAINKNAVYANGRKLTVNTITNPVFWNTLTASNNIQVGSAQGNVRSISTYNTYGFYDRLLTEEEMIEKTTI